VPVVEEAIVVETGVDEGIAPVPIHQPDPHGDIEFAGWVGARPQIR
jgi:hypothetical protein